MSDPRESREPHENEAQARANDVVDADGESAATETPAADAPATKKSTRTLQRKNKKGQARKAGSKRERRNGQAPQGDGDDAGTPPVDAALQPEPDPEPNTDAPLEGALDDQWVLEQDPELDRALAEERERFPERFRSSESSPEEKLDEPREDDGAQEPTREPEPDAAPPLEAEPSADDEDDDEQVEASNVSREHLKGLLEALIFVSDAPIKLNDLARAASARRKEVRSLLAELRAEYTNRGIQLDEVAGGWIFRTNPVFAPFVRDLTRQKPVKLTRAQLETLAILAYRQPITRPEIDEIRGVDSGAALKMLLERDLIKILGKKDEPGRPLLYGTGPAFLEFFGLKSLKDLPTLREFTELNEESRRVVERELGEVMEARQEQEDGGDEPAVASDPEGTVEPVAPATAEDEPTLPEADEVAPAHAAETSPELHEVVGDPPEEEQPATDPDPG